uniref:Vesicle transport through interaction with t-SNAREs 1A n=1 Tax=Dromaius novaehollandiae TaxID=8790 RepID=A0A8C4KDE2_DRONO
GERAGSRRRRRRPRAAGRQRGSSSRSRRPRGQREGGAGPGAVSRRLKRRTGAGSCGGTRAEAGGDGGAPLRVAERGSGSARSGRGAQLSLRGRSWGVRGAAAIIMSSDFESYEQDFAVLTAEVTGRIGKVPKLVGDEKKQMVANVEKQLEEARELLEQMELEVREIPPQSRGMYSSRMRSYKQEMGKLEADFLERG